MHPVYKNVSNGPGGSRRKLAFKQNVQSWIKSSLDDPIGRILAKNSNLTKTQLETLIIDVLAENLSSKQLKYEEKAKLRQTKVEISRGSFNRTLKQAKINVINSVYTILLLGYFGILEDASLTPYVELSNKLKDYREAYRDILQTPDQAEEQLKVVGMLREELENTLNHLTKPWTSRT
jgi:hypothetical protein